MKGTPPYRGRRYLAGLAVAGVALINVLLSAQMSGSQEENERISFLKIPGRHLYREEVGLAIVTGVMHGIAVNQASHDWISLPLTVIALAVNFTITDLMLIEALEKNGDLED